MIASEIVENKNGNQTKLSKNDTIHVRKIDKFKQYMTKLHIFCENYAETFCPHALITFTIFSPVNVSRFAFIPSFRIIKQGLLFS